MTPEAIAAFNAEQQRTDRHPLTCGNPQCDSLPGVKRELKAYPDGIRCPWCGWRQPLSTFEKRKVQSWPAPIPVAERLPERDKHGCSVDVLLWDARNQRWHGGYYRFVPNDYAAAGWESADEWEDANWTHWLPLPPAP